MSPANMTPTRREMGIRIKAVREERGLTQAEVASRASITTTYYAQIERGEVNVSTDKFEKILHVLKVKSSRILPF